MLGSSTRDKWSLTPRLGPALAGDYHLASAEGKRCQFYIHDWPWPSSDLMVWWYDDVVCPVSCGCGCGCLVRRFITLCSLTNQIASQCHCLSVYLLRYLVLDIQISNKWNQNKSPCPFSTRVCRFKCTTMALILKSKADKSWISLYNFVLFVFFPVLLLL